MKNKIIFIGIVLLLSISMYSCKKDETKDVSKVTTYAILTLHGAEDTVIATGSTWVDPGVSVSTGDPFTISGTVNTSTAGRYPLTYNALNADGFPSSASRTVWVVGVTGDGGTNYAGTYEGGRGASYSNEMGDGQVYLQATSIPGVYFCTDMFARYYEVWRGYGLAYRCPGVIRVNADKTFDNADVEFVSPWGDCFIIPGTAAVDIITGKFTYRLNLGGSAVAAKFFLEPQP